MTEQLSISERVLAEVECRLRKVRQANGFRTDAGLRVSFARETLNASDGEGFDVSEGDESINGKDGADGSSDSYNVALTIHVVGYASAAQAETGRQLQQLKADAKKAVLINRGGLKDDLGRIPCVIAYSGASPSSREDGNSSEQVDLTFIVTYREGYGDPYATR